MQPPTLNTIYLTPTTWKYLLPILALPYNIITITTKIAPIVKYDRYRNTPIYSSLSYNRPQERVVLYYFTPGANTVTDVWISTLHSILCKSFHRLSKYRSHILESIKFGSIAPPT